MSLYLDTSVLVAAVTNEPDSPGVRTWLAGPHYDELLISEWVTAEVSSALALKERTRQITGLDRIAALRASRRMAVSLFKTVPVLSAHFYKAAELIDRGALPLRAADALHLAVAMEHSATLCTLDRSFAAAARVHGAQTLRP